jgi:hypothetical protein
MGMKYLKNNLVSLISTINVTAHKLVVGHIPDRRSLTISDNAGSFRS